MSRPRRLPKVLSAAETASVLDQFNTRYPTPLRNLCVVRTMLEAGLRVGEVVALRPDHLDMTTCKLVVREGKGAKDRVLWVPDSLRDLIGAWLERRPESPWLFPTRHGGQVSTRYVREMVKRVVSIRWGSLAAPSASSGFGAPKGGVGVGIGSSRRSRRGSSAPAAKAKGQSRAAGPDFSYSYTGRKSNSLYDVRLVDVELVIETTQIPAVLDAISRQNFITIIGLSMTPADPYQAVAEGYFYGAEPVSNVTLQLETLWLRAWTTQFMPPALKETLGIPSSEMAAG